MSKDVGLRIKKLREQLNLTQTEFSDKICVKQANLSHIENKGTKISLEIINKIISNFNINPEWLLTGDGEMLKTTSESPTTIKQPVPEIIYYRETIKGKDMEIKELNREIISLNKENERLRSENEILKAENGTLKKHEMYNIEDVEYNKNIG
jgi:transcriptional regulator with XRE-family HTH domain